LSLFDNQVDSSSGTIRLKASFPNENNALWPGLSVIARLLVATFRDVVVVPDSAVQRGPNGLYAYVVGSDGRAELRHLKVARVEDGNALVEQGLSAGEQLVVSWHYRVQPRAPLQILGTAERTGTKVDCPATASTHPAVRGSSLRGVVVQHWKSRILRGEQAASLRSAMLLTVLCG